MIVAAIILGYCLNATDGNFGPSCSEPDPSSGSGLFWPVGDVEYEFNDNGSGDLGSEVFPAIDNGFHSWNEVSGIQYSFDGCTSRGRSSVIDGGGDVSDGDNHNIVTWLENSWPYGGGTIAITWTLFFTDGQVVEADILMNGEDYFWTTQNSGGATDVEGIIAHESGHFLGLDHTTDTTATMFASVVQGDTSLRSLSSDDTAGVQSVYGSSPSSGAQFDGECEAGGGGGEGCGCSLSGPPVTEGKLAGLVSVLALAGAFVARQRRTRLGTRRIGAVAAAMLAFFVAQDASATVAMDLSLEDLARASDAVIHGDVESVEVQTDGRYIRTVQRVRVRETIAGLAQGDVVEIVTPGGALPEGQTTDRGVRGARAAGIPTFEPGEEVVVFAVRRPDDRLTVSSLQQGKLRVVRDAKGAATVVRDLSGLLRLKRHDDATSAVVEDAYTGLPLEDLVERIRVLPTRVSP